METFIEAWNLICDYLKNQIPEVSYNLWIGKIEPVNLDFSSGSVVLKVSTPFHRDIIMKSYQNNLKEAFNNVLGSEFQIDILTEDQMELQEETKEETKKSDDYEFTFETFIVGPSNKFAHAAAMAVATKPAVLYNPLFIYGNSGLGKTHLLYAICNEIEKNNPNINIVYIKGDEFTNELIEAIRRGTTAEFRQKYRKSDVLLVDDIQFIAGKESTQEEFFHTFNELHQVGKQIVLTSDRPPKDIATLEERLLTRFEWGLTADIQPPDFETRIAIIKRKAELLEFHLPDQVAEYIAKIFEDKNILLLANTNAAKNNLERRIKSSCDCYTVYDYLKNGYSWKKYDLVILDECSTVCNEDVLNLFEKCNAEAYLLIGDIYQIEAIKFGNWFNFARYFVDKKSVYELVTPYRAKDKSILLDMWTCVRNFDENMFERLLANGFISTLNESIFERDDDEIVLCLGYDGLYGVNNINRYMQKINPSKPIEWGNWTYKVGDKVLFNESRRFGNVLYNNLKGSILSIDKKTDEIVFQILVDKIISERDVLFSDIKLIDCDCEGKSIVEFSVKRRVERDSDSDYSEQIVPFQIAYAVSIHKAQGLEYKSVKVVITEDIDEKISHNIFYTAITRTTDKLKIYMSKETQKKLAEKFVKSNVGLKQAQLFAGQAGLKLKNKLSS